MVRTMPGFRILSDRMMGAAADRAREASAREEIGDRAGAIDLYESALAEALLDQPQLPGFICGRLAAIYRREGRYQDEVDLLERYRDSQTEEDARARFNARLSKALALAEKYRMRDSAALASVRAIKKSPKRAHRATPPSGTPADPTPE